MCFAENCSGIIELVEFGVPVNDIDDVIEALRVIEPDVFILDSIFDKMSKMNANPQNKEQIIRQFIQFNLMFESFDNNDYWKYCIDNIPTKEQNEIIDNYCLLHV